jgi:hypothetical protein
MMELHKLCMWEDPANQWVSISVFLFGEFFSENENFLIFRDFFTIF